MQLDHTLTQLTFVSICISAKVLSNMHFFLVGQRLSVDVFGYNRYGVLAGTKYGIGWNLLVHRPNSCRPYLHSTSSGCSINLFSHGGK